MSGLLGVAGAVLPNPIAAAAVGGAVGGLYSAVADHYDPSGHSSQLLVSAFKGAAAALLGQTAGPLVGGGAGLALGFVLPATQPASRVGLDTMGIPRLQKSGLSGKGVGVALIDTGCAPRADLQKSVAVYKDFLGDQPQRDDNGHGTRMAGLIHQVAPEAHLAVLRVGDGRGHIGIEEVESALDWVHEHRTEFNLQVVNMSFGFEGCAPAPISEKIATLAQEGVLVCTSAGNEGAGVALEDYKCAPGVISVANFDSRGSVDAKDDRLVGDSNADPSITMAAPGHDILDNPHGLVPSRSSGGTSEASAIGSGLLALWKEARPELQVGQAKELIRKSPLSVGGIPIPQAEAIRES